MKSATTRLTLAATAALAGATLLACGGGGGGYGSSGTPTPTPTPATGTLSVAMTDAPSCGFDAVNVTVNKVRVHASASAGDTDSGWSDIVLSPARKINLLSLTNGVLETLGQTTLPAGKYTQVRLVLDANTGDKIANSVLPIGKVIEEVLDTPSAVTSGIKLVGDIDVVAGQRADLLLDFDACKSVLTKGNGNYALKPVVKVIPAAVNGISGYVSTSSLASGVRVSAQQGGVIIGATVPNASTGEFFLSHLPPGNYDVVITADQRAAAVIGAVPVATSTSTTSVSSALLPITMASATMASVGGVVTLSPASSTEAAYVTARQSFAAGPTVTIRYQGADLVSGAYVVDKLPLEAPRYAAYSAVLPLVFSAAANTTPGTGKYQVTASATGYTSKSVASVDAAVQPLLPLNFTLVP